MEYLKQLGHRLYRQLLALKKMLTDLTEKPFTQGIPYWTGAALVGLVAVVYSGLFSSCISIVRELFDSHPYWLFLTSPVSFVLSTWLVEKYAPGAGGTGIPQVTRALKLDETSPEKEFDYYLSLKTCFIVVVSSLLGVLGAGSLGREGPVVHIAACVFYFVGRQFSRLWPSSDHRSWIVAGGAAGVAAAFNAPLAGVVFVLEELAQQHFHQFKTVVISAAIIGGVVSQWLSGKYLYFGYPKIGVVTLSAIPWAILVGVTAGILAYPFNQLLRINWRNKLPQYFRRRLQFSVVIGIIMAALANFVNSASIGGGILVVEDVLLDGEKANLSLFLSRFLGTIVSHLGGGAGGFLAPSLALGATIGSLVSSFIHYPNHNLMVLVGMAAFLSAIVRAPFTAWVIVMEMTDRHQAIFPLMVASLISHATLSYISDPKRLT